MRNKLLIAIIGAYYALYECVFFHHPAFLGPAVGAVIGAKIVLPFVLLALAGNPDKRVFENPSTAFYIVWSCALLGVVAISTVLSPNVAVTMYEWFKLPPRLVYFFAILILIRKEPGLLVHLAKAILVLSGLSVLQYLLLIISGGMYQQYTIPGLDAVLAGPFGIFGNVSSMVNQPDLPFPVVRLCGFWNEPSNASASLAVAYFLSRHPQLQLKHPLWRATGTASLIGVFLTLSNAGYLALFGAFTFRQMIRIREGRVFSVVVMLLFILVCLVAVGGREYVARSFPDRPLLKVAFGVRDDITGRNIDEYDAFSGRLFIMNDTLKAVMEYPLGFGVFTGRNSAVQAISASAPLIWLAYGGLLGIVALVLRESVLGYSAFKLGQKTPGGCVIAQALVAVFLQNMSYGDLMGPLYLTLAALVLVYAQDPVLQVKSHPTSFRLASV